MPSARVPTLLSRLSSIQPVTLKPVTGGNISEVVAIEADIGVVLNADVARTAGFSFSSKRMAGSNASAEFAFVQFEPPSDAPSRQIT